MAGQAWSGWLESTRSKAEGLVAKRAWPIRLHLVLFAMALLAPILLFSAVLANHFVTSERRLNERLLLASAHSLAADADRDIAGMITTLKALANSPSLQHGDLEAFYTQAKLTLAPYHRNAVLMDMSGKQLVNTRVAWGTELPYTQRDGSNFPRNIAKNPAPSVSDLFVGTVSQKPLISINVPVFRGDQTAYALVMSMSPSHFQTIIGQAALHEGWLAGISDRENRVLARSLLPEKFIGQIFQEGAAITAGLREGIIETVDLEGRPALQAFRRSDLSGWRFAVWVPVAVIEAPLREFQRSLVALGGTSLLLVTLLAIYFGRRLSAPIAAASEAGRMLGSGKVLKPLSSPLREANEVVDALRLASVEIRQRTRDLRNSETRTRLAQNLAGLATFDWNLKTGQIVCSENFQSLFGLAEHAPVTPETLLAAVHPEDRERVSQDLERTRNVGGDYEVEFRVLASQNEVRWIAGTGEAILDHDETPQRVVGANYDVSEFKRAAETNAQLAAVVQSTLDAVMSMDADGSIRTWNPGAEALFGYGRDEIIGRSTFTLYPEAARLEHEDIYRELAQGQSVRRDVLRRHKNGEILQVNVNIAPMYAASGELAGFSAVVRDISDRKRHEDHLRLLMRELSHRSKNLLAVIQAMARQTARSSTDLEEFEKNYSQRLQALSASHDLLVNQNWHGAPLADLLRSILVPFADEPDERIHLTGPDVSVTPIAAQNLALAVHELATNASKYGALSNPAGRVAVDWDFANAANGEPRLRISWKESGGPPVREPRRRGFGHIVIDRMVAQALDADVDLAFAPEGVSWTLRMPTAYVAR